MPSSPRAVVLGGTGAIGAATAIRLAHAGWKVAVTARDASRVPPEFATSGVTFHAMDRTDVAGITNLFGAGADLLVDLVAYDRPTLATLHPLWRGANSVVVMSSRAVYVDSEGRHINGDEPPHFTNPLHESNPTLDPATDDVDPYSREGYAPAKVAIERDAMASGLPVSVIRPSKVHGRYARNPRTAAIVERMLSGADRIELTNRGASVDHLTAAENTAALIETIAANPGSRILNSADPDALTAAEIVRAISDSIGWSGEVIGLEPGEPGGEHPWSAPNPIVLDTSASLALGYSPVGTGRDLLAREAQWIAAGSPFGPAIC